MHTDHVSVAPDGNLIRSLRKVVSLFRQTRHVEQTAIETRGSRDEHLKGGGGGGTSVHCVAVFAPHVSPPCHTECNSGFALAPVFTLNFISVDF